MGTQTEIIKRRAPTLYAIIIIKLLKGLLFVGLAITIYALSDNDLPTELNRALHVLRFNPERKFWSDLAIQRGVEDPRSAVKGVCPDDVLRLVRTDVTSELV